MEKTEQDPKAWLAAQVESLDGTQARAKKSTIGTLRSAILYYLRWQHFAKNGMLMPDEAAEVIGKQLSTASEGDRGTERFAPTEGQMQAYQEAVEALPVAVQIKTVLLLLPITGMRIFEACGLRVRNVVRRGTEWKLSIVGKGNKPRIIPLNKKSCDLLLPYLKDKKDDAFLFENPYRDVVPWSRRYDLSPAQVRAVVRERLQSVEALSDIVPHVLRHQFATAIIRKKVDIFTVKRLMGHSSTATLERYTHPDEDMMRDAVNLLDET